MYKTQLMTVGEGRVGMRSTLGDGWSIEARQCLSATSFPGSRILMRDPGNKI